MLFLLFIILGALLGALMNKKFIQNKTGGTIMFWLLLLLIFLMGTEIDPRSVTPLLLFQAAGLSIGSMIGSVACLLLSLFFFHHHD